MSEEKPTFKITDRRLFNADGTPRPDAVREEPAEPAPAPTEATAGAARAATGDAPTASASAAPRAAPQPEAGAAESATEGGGDAGGQPGAEEDPTPFANLVMFIASPAAAAMGMTEHPSMPPGELDLPLARHCIELLATVRDKTRGNLGAQEGQILESLLAELRMQYVSLTSSARAPKSPPRGFTGGDITGGDSC
ncbi:MAG: DUF1844 domain-containing protein [Acidobacteria bacterium]|nr:DUF1844 domain-containing protein [Acidobacteriota bacterium]MCA1642678.1 DUF1844 domain-containing protein [Acidobacteriota bacterium]